MPHPNSIANLGLRLLTIIVGSLLLVHGARAQSTITVLEGDGKPVIGAHVKVDDNAIGVTNAQGMFTIPAERFENGTADLSISFIGFQGIEQDLVNGENVELRMQPRTAQLGEFVVTGQYRPGDPRRVVHQVRVVGQERLQELAARDIGDALANETNIRIAQDNILGSSMSMQGLSGQNVKILVDGVPVVGRLDGNIDLSQIDVGGVQRIEVVEGPLAVNYGTDALAGVINIITRDSSQRTAYRADMYAEHIGRLNLNAGSSWVWGKSNFQLDLGRKFFDGWDPGHGGFRLERELADSRRHKQWKPREQYMGRLNYHVPLGKLKLGYKGEVMHDRIVDRGLPRAPYEVSAFDEEYRTLRLDNALFADHAIGQHLHLNVIMAHNRYERTRNTWLRDLTTLEGRLMEEEGMQDTTRFELSNVRLTLSSANDSSKWHWQLGADLNYETGSGARIGEGGEASIGDYAGFFSMEYHASDALVLRPGVRYAYNTRYEAPIVPSLNMRWKLNKYTLRASYAQGFRAPSIKEQWFRFVDVNHDIMGNQELMPERSDNFNLGVARHWSKGNRKGAKTQRANEVQLSGFYNDIHDLITLAQVQGTSYTYVNIGKFRTVGGRLGASSTLNELSWRASFGLTGRDDGSQEEFQFTPESRASVTWRPKGGAWSITAVHQFQGEVVGYALVEDVELERNTIGSYHLLDANIGRRVWKDRLTLSVGCKDLLDTRNAQLIGSAGGVHDGGASAPLTTGRTFFLRASMRWRK